MNFMQLIKSLDDLLYELMSWLIFFPLTLWRTVVRPLKMMAYARRELGEAAERQFSEALSPPLFLLLALLISHGLEMALDGATNVIVSENHGLAQFVDNDTKLLILRLAVFSMIPLLLATIATVANRTTLSDEALKLPFYEQCYPAAPFALALGIGTLMLDRGTVWTVLGVSIVFTALVAYLAVQIVWFRRQLGCGILRASLFAISAITGGVLFTLMIGFLFI